MPKNAKPIFSGDLRASVPAGVTSLFFGLTVSREVVTQSRRPLFALTREKSVSIGAGGAVSPHVVNLKPASARASSANRRPQLDLEQRAAVFIHRVKSVFTSRTAEEELRAMVYGNRPAVSEAPVLNKPQTPNPKPQTSPKFQAPKRATHDEIAAKVRKLEAVMAARPVAVAVVAPPLARRSQSDGGKPAKAPRIQTMPDVVVEKRPALPLLTLNGPWFRQVATFAAVAVLITLPLHMIASYAGLLRDADSVSAQTKDAFTQLKSAGDGTIANTPGSAEAFEKAAATFAETRSHLQSATLAVAAFAAGRGETFASGSRLLSAGEALSKAGGEISAAFNALDGSGAERVTDRLKKLSVALAEAEPHLNDAVRELDGIDAHSVPDEHRALFELVRHDLRSVRDNTHRFIKSSDLVMRLLGSENKRRYLVVFQNDRELRPTGGFIGSFALMDIDQGEIMDVEIPAGGSYDMRWGLNERLAAPEQLRLVNNRWEFQDSNWFADFPTSAKTMMWFYEKSGGPTVDGVIAIDTSLMENLLKLLGPVDMPGYGKTITGDNFFMETQKAVELEYDKATNKPKQFISDLAPKVLEKLVAGDKTKLPALMNALSASLVGKDMQVYFRDADEQAAASDFGWTGELKGLPDADFLAVIDANIAGGKTDGVISADIRHETDIADDGGIIDTVIVRRTHDGKKGELFTGIKNIAYVRFYVPVGSELIAAEGFGKPGDGYFMKVDETLKPSPLLAAVEGGQKIHAESGTRITEESGFTVFGNWVQLEPGESKAYRISYRLPYSFQQMSSVPDTWWEELKARVGAWTPTADIKLVVKKQSGAARRNFTSVIHAPAGWEVLSRVPDDADAALDHDLYYGTVLTKND